MPKYPTRPVGNMDETPVFFDMVSYKSFLKKGLKLVPVRTSAFEKQYVRVVVAMAACGATLYPMMIFPRKNVSYQRSFCSW